MKGQSLLIGVLLILAVAAVVIPLVSQTLKDSPKEQEPNLQLYADSVIDTLASPGVPRDWTTETVKKPGIADRSQIREDLLLEYQQMSYGDSKRMLGLGSEEYAFFLLDESGRALTVGDKASFGWKGDDSVGNGAVEWTQNWEIINNAATNLAKAEKPMTFRGKVVQLVVYVWSGRYVQEYSVLPACMNSVDDDKDGFMDFPWDSGCINPEDTTEFDLATYPDCFDGIDNDGDGLIDYPVDPGCAYTADTSETNPNPLPQCADHLDNDADGQIDYPVDTTCESASDNDESANSPISLTGDACNNGVDNDYDGWNDFPLDPGCTSLTDTDENDAGTPPACANGADDDSDTLVDFPWDPGCESASDTEEGNPAQLPACGDGINNDGDSAIDFPNDYGCDYASDNDEANPATLYSCHDGIDNDGDSFVDYPDEPGCAASTDSSEYNYGDTPCSDGQDNDGDGSADESSSCMSAADMSEQYSGSAYGTAGVCGDNHHDIGEQCERGWTKTIPTAHQTVCGTWPPDEADYACSYQCTWQYQGGTSGVCQPNSADCDPGYSCVGCTACNVVCGDRQTGGSEECDPPGGTCANGQGACTAGCVCEVCGNGRVDPLEQCDPPGSVCDATSGTLCDNSCACPIPVGGGGSGGSTTPPGGSGAGCTSATPPTGVSGSGNACTPDDCPAQQACMTSLDTTGSADPSQPTCGTPQATDPTTCYNPNYGTTSCGCVPHQQNVGTGASCSSAPPPTGGNVCTPDDCPATEICVSSPDTSGSPNPADSNYNPNYGVSSCACQARCTGAACD